MLGNGWSLVDIWLPAMGQLGCCRISSSSNNYSSPLASIMKCAPMAWSPILRVLRTLGLTTVPPMVTWPSAMSTTCSGAKGTEAVPEGGRHSATAPVLQQRWVV